MTDEDPHDMGQEGRTNLNGRDRDRCFPALTGSGVVAALLLERLAFPSGFLFFPLFAMIVAVPIGTLRIRRGRVVWLGARYTAACCASVLALLLPLLLMGVLNPNIMYMIVWALQTLYLPNGVDVLLLVVFIAFEGGLSAWVSSVLLPWVRRESREVARARPRWNPQSWGVVGKVAGAFVLLGTAAFAWMTAMMPSMLSLGPSRLWAFGSQVEMGVLVIIGLAGLLVEAVDGPTYKRLW